MFDVVCRCLLLCVVVLCCPLSPVVGWCCSVFVVVVGVVVCGLLSPVVSVAQCCSLFGGFVC